MEKNNAKRNSKYLALVLAFLLVVNLSLGFLLVRQSNRSIVSLMHTRMLDVSNTAAAMLDGDVLRTVTPEDEGTEGYDSVMRTLTYFQDNIELKYIYCIRDMGDGTFTFGLDPTVEDPGEFGSPIVYTDALYAASRGIPSADDVAYEDAWGRFYSAYSPVFDSLGEVAGIVAVDFSADWFQRQLDAFTRTIVVVALLSLLAGGGIVAGFLTRNARRIGSIHGQLRDLETTLLQEMGNAPMAEDVPPGDRDGEDLSMDALERQIQVMQTELRTQIAQVHGQAFRDGLTGVKSKHAYLEMERALDEKLGLGTLPGFAVVVCDVNGLKKINDTRGHQAGDEYIRKACRMVCDIFSHSPVYRVGGDEFAVLLTGRDYENRGALMNELHRQSSAHISTGEAIVSGGAAEYRPGEDRSVRDIFQRADATMYKEKMLLKSLGAEVRESEETPWGKEGELEDILARKVRRHILIADDIPGNREILGELLQEDYGIYYAADGAETLELLRAHKDEIALLLLDLYMPNLDGREVMTAMQVDEDLMSIPVIVLTVDQDAELDCLKIGAMDFIPKPYPDIDIVKARIAKCIELSENRTLIRYTQRDRMTGLLNIDYFLRYVNRFDQQYRDTAFDAVVCDVAHLHTVNHRYGHQFGDLLLRRIGTGLQKLARNAGGIGCRQGGDSFLLYCPHQEDYGPLLRKLAEDLFVEKDKESVVRLRFGVYANASPEEEVEERFARAKSAADQVEDRPDEVCGLRLC